MTSPLPGEYAQLVTKYTLSCPEHGEATGFPSKGAARFAVDEHNRRYHRSASTYTRATESPSEPGQYTPEDHAAYRDLLHSMGKEKP